MAASALRYTSMNDWLRSITLLGMAFAAVVVVTLGLAGVLVPTAGGNAPPADPDESADPAATADSTVAQARQGVVGGTLVVTGDRDGSLVVNRELTQDRYGLAGDDGRIVFEGTDPVTIRQVQFDGLDFFVDPEECTVTPAERHDPTGVALAEIRCEAITDVRDTAAVSLEGTVGMAADLFGLRGDLPESGGTIQLGDETLAIGITRLFLAPFAGASIGQLVAEDHGAAVSLTYDPFSHGLSVAEVVYDGDVTRVDGGCSVSEREIGLLNPHTRVSELRVECARIEIPTLGTVPLTGTVVAELVEPEPRPGFRP
jgi:hypothetical protein